MTMLPPSPFLDSAASLPAASESAAAAQDHQPAAVEPIEELMCMEPSLIRVLDAGRSGRTDCSPIDSIGRDPEDGAVKAWSPGPRAVTGDNSEPIPAREKRYPPGCPDPDWCISNKGCYWNCRDDGTDHIGEIFHHARKLLAEDNRRAENFVDWQALEAALEEPLPLFIREGEHLKRRAA